MKWLRQKDVLNVLTCVTNEIELTFQGGQMMATDALRLQVVKEIRDFVREIKGKEVRRGKSIEQA